MKNTKKLFLIFLMVFGFLVLNIGIADAAITDGLPADIGGFSSLTVFDFNASGNPYLIAGEGNINPLSFDAFRWNGTSWADSTVDIGLPNSIDFSHPAIFTMGGDWYLIAGKENEAFDGFKRSGGTGPWVVSAINNGLIATGGSWSAPTIFPKDGFSTFPTGGKYLIAGKQDGIFDGYKFGAGGWVANAGITSGLPDVGWTSTITVFKMGTNWYAITGTGSGDGEGGLFPRFQGFKWSGGAWVKDTVIDNGLFSTGTVYQSDPEVFNIGTQYYLIFGERDGRFFGFHWNDAIKSWVAEVSDNTPPVVDSLTISDSEDTYTGGITTFNTLGNITINATAHDEVGGSGLSDFRIYWYYESVPATTYSSANGAGSGSASTTINLSTHAGDTIHYYAKAVDGGPNETQSPSWGEWCVNVKAEPAAGNFSYTNSCRSETPSGSYQLIHSFIFPKDTDTNYYITNIGEDVGYLFGGQSFCEINYKINGGAENILETDFSFTSPYATFSHNLAAEGKDFSTNKNEKLAIGFKIRQVIAGPPQKTQIINEIVAGTWIVCVPNGGACVADGDCCDNHCDNNVCCVVGECCVNDTPCNTSDVCSTNCSGTNHSCNLGTFSCQSSPVNCGAGTSCQVGGGNVSCPGGAVEICDNAPIDDDCDGDVDCDDSDCIGDPACTEICDDGLDNDGDGDTDCADVGDCPECTNCGGGNVCMGGSCIALAAENCGDGLDNNCNSLIDCADTGPCPECANCGGANRCMSLSCVLPPGSEAGMCADGINNDCENGTDCADSDCAGDPACDCDSDQNFCETGAICPGFVCNGATCWNRGGESSAATCCGDSGDPGEIYLSYDQFSPDNCDDITNNACVGKNDDSSDDACCNSGPFGCAYNGNCYAQGVFQDIDGDGVLGEYCATNKWSDCDRSSTSCGWIATWAQGGESAQFGEYDSGNATECCGDDADEFLATQGPGIAAHGSKCCNSALTHGLVGDTGSCIECIANGQNDGGNSAWCCSSHSQNGICCVAGACCTIDSQCPADVCSICALTDHYCNVSTYSCDTHNETCTPGTHCSGNSCQPAVEICENGNDEDCDGVDNPCCHWQDDGCGKHNCDIWTERGEICLPIDCACPPPPAECCTYNNTRCVADDLCSTFGLPDRTILEILLDVVDWLLGIIAVLAFLMIVIGGTIYLSSSGDVTRIETAKKIVTYAIIGLVVAGVSYTVIHLVFDLLQ